MNWNICTQCLWYGIYIFSSSTFLSLLFCVKSFSSRLFVCILEVFVFPKLNTNFLYVCTLVTLWKISYNTVCLRYIYNFLFSEVLLDNKNYFIFGMVYFCKPGLVWWSIPQCSVFPPISCFIQKSKSECHTLLSHKNTYVVCVVLYFLNFSWKILPICFHWELLGVSRTKK